MDNVAKMFETEDAEVIQKITQIAEHIATEDYEIEKATKELSARKLALDASREQLANFMTQNGVPSIKLDCGLTPKPKITTKIFKAAGIDDPTLFAWLQDHDLDDIIKPTVHWSTLNRSLKDWIELNNADLPEIFNVSETPSINMYGKSKYIANKFKEQE